MKDQTWTHLWSCVVRSPRTVLYGRLSVLKRQAISLDRRDLNLSSFEDDMPYVFEQVDVLRENLNPGLDIMIKQARCAITSFHQLITMIYRFSAPLSRRRYSRFAFKSNAVRSETGSIAGIGCRD